MALDCEMVDVQCQDGRVRGAAARVCVVDEAERVLLHSLIKPAGLIVDYKFEFTGESRLCVWRSASLLLSSPHPIHVQASSLATWMTRRTWRQSAPRWQPSWQGRVTVQPSRPQACRCRLCPGCWWVTAWRMT